MSHFKNPLFKECTCLNEIILRALFSLKLFCAGLWHTLMYKQLYVKSHYWYYAILWRIFGRTRNTLMKRFREKEKRELNTCNDCARSLLSLRDLILMYIKCIKKCICVWICQKRDNLDCCILWIGTHCRTTVKWMFIRSKLDGFVLWVNHKNWKMK